MTASSLRIDAGAEPSFLTPPAYGVGSFLVHVRVTPRGSLDVIRVFAGDTGIQDVARGETSRSKLRAEFEGLAKTLRTRPIAMPAPYVAARIRALVDEDRAAGRALSPRDAKVLEALPAGDDPPHPTRAWPEVPDAAARVADSLSLHGEAEVSRWLPSGRAVAFVSEHVARAREGGAGADDDETRAAFSAAIDAFYDETERRRLALALRDVAVLFGASRRVEQARSAIAVADALASTAAPHDVPFVFGLFYKFLLARREAEARKG